MTENGPASEDKMARLRENGPALEPLFSDGAVPWFTHEDEWVGILSRHWFRPGEYC